jgi:hypothetical protein
MLETLERENLFVVPVDDERLVDPLVRRPASDQLQLLMAVRPCLRPTPLLPDGLVAGSTRRAGRWPVLRSSD